MEENKDKLKILYLLSNGLTGDIYLDKLPNIGDFITVYNKTYRVVEGHDSMVKRGSHSSVPESHWDWVVQLS